MDVPVWMSASVKAGEKGCPVIFQSLSSKTNHKYLSLFSQSEDSPADLQAVHELQEPIPFCFLKKEPPDAKNKSGVCFWPKICVTNGVTEDENDIAGRLPGAIYKVHKLTNWQYLLNPKNLP